MNDLRQSKEFAQFLKLQGWLVEEIKGGFAYIRKIPLAPFSVIKVQRPTAFDFNKINRLAQKYRAFTVYLEPKDTSDGGRGVDLLRGEKIEKELFQNGFHLSRSPFLPTKTIRLDLTLSEKKLLAQMKKDARYSLRRAKKSCKVAKLQSCKNTSEVKLKPSHSPRGWGKNTTPIKAFHRAWKKAASWRHHVPSFKTLTNLKAAFGLHALFLSILSPDYHDSNHGSQIIAGTIILLADQTAYYYYAFTSKEGRQKLAQYLLVWEAIKLAKKQKCKVFDFEGIYDQRFPIKAWQGFSHFKKSFGGQEVEYPGCFSKKGPSFLRG